jgi:hypothetical protein
MIYVPLEHIVRFLTDAIAIQDRLDPATARVSLKLLPRTSCADQLKFAMECPFREVSLFLDT